MTDKTTEKQPLIEPIAEQSVFDVFKDFGSAGQGVTNFMGDRNATMVFIAEATSGESLQGGEHVGEEIDFDYWFVHAVEIENKDSGEMMTVPRVVLFTPQGNSYSFASFGVYQSLRTILQFLGTGVLSPPARVCIRQKRTRKGYGVLFLKPVVSD